MSHRIRKHFPTVAIALVAGMVGAQGPAIAHGVHALFAHNADKVDGIHAVKATAANKNKKLVATTAAGLFPLSVIPKADAETLDGQDSTAFAPSTHPHSGADITSGEVDEGRIDPDITRDSELTGHGHSGADITSGEVDEARIDPDITRDAELAGHNHDGAYSPLGHNHDGAYSQLGHGHSGADINSGIVDASRIDSAIARDTELPTAGSGLTNSGGVFSVNTSTIQSRVTGSCAGNNFVQSILSNGTVTCGAGNTGDITDVTTSVGSGLGGGTSSGNANLFVDFIYAQRRVNASCSPGQSIRVIDSSGNVTCEVDDVGTGDITDVTTAGGSGLNGGASSGNANLSVDFNTAQRRVTGTCPAGQSIRTIESAGTVICEADDNSGGDIDGVTANPGLTGGGTSGTVALAPNFTGSGGDNGILFSVARGDHLHDARYVRLSPASSQTIGQAITFTGATLVSNTLRVTGLTRMGSETGPAEVPNSGIIVRRINNSSMANGTIIAASGSGGNMSTIQADGTVGGLKFVATDSFQTITCMGVTSTGAVVGRAIGSNSGLTQQIFTDVDDVRSTTCTFGNATGPTGASTELTIHREMTSTGSFEWLGSMITTTNQ